MFIYLVGPAGVGKNLLAKSLNDGSQFLHINLDGMVSARNGKLSPSQLIAKNGDSWYWAECKKVLDELAAKYRAYQMRLLVTIGSATLANQGARTFLAGKNTVALLASPGEVFIKHKQKCAGSDLSFFDWEQAEFSPERARLYDACKLKIDLSELSEAEAAQKFRAEMQKVDELFGRS